jgi:hypothetical protein
MIQRGATALARLAVGAARLVKASNGTDVINDTIANVLLDLLTTRGDLIRRGAATVERLALPANRGVLGSDGTDLTGIGGQFSARVFRSAALSIVNATITAISFDAEDYDLGALHNLGVNPTRLTVPAGGAGRYAVCAGISYATNATGIRQIRFNKNGVLESVSAVQPVNTGNSMYLLGSTILDLAATDYVEVAAYQESGAGLALNVSRAETWAAMAQLMAQ